MTVPNNIGLEEDPALERQLTAYQQRFRAWWKVRGPSEFLERPIDMRVPTGGVGPADWAEYRRLHPNDYRWGIYHAPVYEDRIAFGRHRGDDAWEEAPGEYRTLLLQHLRVQGDVENAAIEQSRTLTRLAPSAPDLDNLFLFYLEEGRHTWAMVHLLLAHFGEDGLVEAEALLERGSGDAHRPRLLGAFNEPVEDWLSHFMWCFLADRVGKYQIQAVTRSAFAPLARAARFMMLEEPLHIAFGSIGLERVLCKTIEATLREGHHDIFRVGAIPLPVIQKYFNFWVPKIYDLFGNDLSQRSYDVLRAGIRAPRGFVEGEEDPVTVDALVDGGIETTTVAAERATNAIMRRQLIAEVQRVFDRWNASLRAVGLRHQFVLPHERFDRNQGACAGLPFDLDGQLLSGDTDAKLAAYLPTAADRANLRSLMQRELAPGRFASWIAPPGARVGGLVGKPGGPASPPGRG